MWNELKDNLRFKIDTLTKEFENDKSNISSRNKQLILDELHSYAYILKLMRNIENRN